MVILEIEGVIMKGQDIKKELQRLSEEKRKINSEIMRVRNLCQHEELFEYPHNFQGNYDGLVITKHLKKCRFCGTVVEVKSVK